MPGKTVYTLADVMAAPVDGSGYHDQYGLLGSNKATEEKLKLFPRSCQPVVDAIQARIQKERGIQVEVMVYGDGAFKDPIGEHLGAGRPRGLPRLHRRSRRQAQ